jgi:hypothetical protein
MSLHDFSTGTRVQVRNRFNQHWASGFEVADVTDLAKQDHPAYRLRRLSDNRVLPGSFEEEEVRPEG